MSDQKPPKQPPNVSTQQLSNEDEATQPARSGLTIALLMTAHWLAWVAAVTANTLLSIRAHMWSDIQSPIVRYIYRKHIYQWPAGGFYVLQPFFRRWSLVISTVYLISVAICFVVQIALWSRLRPFEYRSSNVQILLWMAVCMVVASFFRLTKEEAGVIVPASSWLSAKTVQLVALRVGVQLGHVPGIKADVVQVGALLMFSIGFTKLFGMPIQFVVFVLLWEAGMMIWRWLNVRSVAESDAERG